jgi:hypothetical protein
LKHIVLDYQQAIRQDPVTKQVIQGESEVAQPLSWHLTQREQNWINGSDKLKGALEREKPVSDQEKIKEGVSWFRKALAKNGAALDTSLACKAHS